MKDIELTIGKLIDNQKTAFIASIDAEGFPNMKAMLKPRKGKVYELSILRQTHPLCVYPNF